MKKIQKNIILALILIMVSVWVGGCSKKKEATQEPTTQPTTVAAAIAEPAQPQATKELQAEPTAAEQATEQPAATEPQPTAPPTEQPSEPAPAAPQATSDRPPAVDDLVARLQGLDIDDFFEESWRELMLRNPEAILGEGLAGFYELQGVELTDISDAHIRETYQIYAALLEMLRTFDRDALSPEQQVSFDVYEWYLDDRLREQEFMYYDYPVTFFITAVHQDVIHFFTDLHPVASKQDAEDYVTRLGLVDTKFEQLLEGLRLREEAGVVPPKFALQWSLGGINGIAGSGATRTPFYTSFAEKVNALDLSAAEKQALQESAREAIDETVIPAFQSLADYVTDLQSNAPIDDGVWQFPNGEAYYAYILRHRTTTDMTPDEVYELGQQELERIHAEMRVIFDELGYPQDENLAELYDRVEKDGGYIEASQVFDTYTTLIEQAEQKLDAAFSVLPQADVIVVASPIKGMYVSGSYDGSRPGAFHAGPGDSAEPWYAMPTLAYHEAIPGHHFQIALAQEMDLPSFRKGMFFTSYAEGWALYAEQLAWELGWYDDDVYGNLGRLQHEAFRAARLVIDTGLHVEGWTFDQASAYLTENVGLEPGDSIEPDHQIARYIVWPGQATTYKIGMIKMLELRQRAMDQLGERFDLQEFHNVVLLNGPMPLSVLERVVDDYIAANLGQPASAEATQDQPESAGTVLVIFGNRFIPEIYNIVPPALEEAGYEIVIASNTLNPLRAKDSDMTAQPDMLLKDVQVQDYDAIVFNCDNDISFGGGQPETNRIAQEAVEQDKVLAAICAAPMVLGYAGVVEGKRVTGEPSNTCRQLERTYGATCTNSDVEWDGLIITAQDRTSSEPFALTIIQALQGR